MATTLRPKDFNHLHLARSAEYQAAYAAIDALANSGLDVLGQEGLAQAVAAMARSVPYGDCCDVCGDVAYPVAVEVDGAHLTAAYYHCHRQWTCGWHVDAPVFMA